MFTPIKNQENYIMVSICGGKVVIKVISRYLIKSLYWNVHPYKIRRFQKVQSFLSSNVTYFLHLYVLLTPPVNDLKVGSWNKGISSKEKIGVSLLPTKVRVTFGKGPLNLVCHHFKTERLPVWHYTSDSRWHKIRYCCPLHLLWPHDKGEFFFEGLFPNFVPLHVSILFP